jgi:hypothetical protein
VRKERGDEGQGSSDLLAVMCEWKLESNKDRMTQSSDVYCHYWHYCLTF